MPRALTSAYGAHVAPQSLHVLLLAEQSGSGITIDTTCSGSNMSRKKTHAPLGSSVNRRQVLKSGVVLATYASTASILSRHSSAADIAGLKVVIDLGGRTYEFLARSGRDMGDFRSEIGGFTQACIRVTRDDSPLTIYFRPDRDNDRIEVVFELGRLWSGKAQDLGAYQATIYSGGSVIAQADVPKHFWFSRWRWQSAPRPLVTDVKTLLERKLLPPYQLESDDGNMQSSLNGATASPPTKVAKGLPSGGGQIKVGQEPKYTEKGLTLGIGASAGSGDAAAKASQLTYSIMGLAGITPAMGTTGERSEIGLLTEYEARYICTGSLADLAITRAQAEAAGTIPWHMRDEHTGAPVDLDTYGEMSWYVGKGNPNIAATTSTSGIEVDTSHQPSLTYFPYLLTGDPYHLEDLQFAVNWNRGALPPGYRETIPQLRGFAWSLRSLAHAAKVTPASVPSWLLPRAYWEKELERTRARIMTKNVNNPSALYTVFRQIADPELFGQDGPLLPAGCWVAPWQNEFIASVLGWVVWMGFDSWRPIYEWKIADTLARTSGSSGWVRAYATPYRMLLRSSANDAFKSWAEAWRLTSTAYNFSASDPDEIQFGNDPTYFLYTRGSLAFAKHLGIPNAEESFAWLDGQLRKHNVKSSYKWRLA